MREPVRAHKFKRFSASKRRTKSLYFLPQPVKCAELRLYPGGRAVTSNHRTQNGNRYVYKVGPPRRYYRYSGMAAHKLACRRPGFMKAEHLDEVVWNDVKWMVWYPGLIVAGMASMNIQADNGWE